MDVYAVIVAGGTGSRFGGNLPKQFATLGGEPVLMHTLKVFRKSLPVERIVTVLGEGMDAYWQKECERFGFETGPLVTGGSSRWQSVRNGFESLNLLPDDIVLIHDAARPFVNRRIIDDVVAAVQKGADGAIPVVPVTDSIRRLNADGTSSALDRSSLRAVQTPQAFSAGKLADAFRLPYSPVFTDEASMMEAAGYHSIVLVEGKKENFKITVPADLLLAEEILAKNARSQGH